MCKACTRYPDKYSSVVQSHLQDIQRSCREGQKRGLPHWLAKPTKVTDLQVAPMPLWLRKHRGHYEGFDRQAGRVVVYCDPRQQKDWNVAVVPVPDMTLKQREAELNRQYRRLCGKGGNDDEQGAA